MDPIAKIFLFETTGTAILLLLGGGVVANAILKKEKGFGGGWLLIAFGWGMAVFCGALVAYGSGAILNPALTLGIALSGAAEYAPGIPVTVGHTFAYFAAQLLGAFLGAVIMWLANKQHFDLEEDPANKLAVFSTGPQIRSVPWNLVTEAIATFVLVFVILAIGKNTGVPLGPLVALPAGLLVLAIGSSLGGPTGYAINPARDLGPRIAHAILPIKGKGGSDWSYSWIPIVGPFIGAALAGLLSMVLLPVLV